MPRVDELRARYPNLRRDADLLLADLLGRSVAWIHAHGEAEADDAEFDALMRRRASGEPLQYIRGRCEFFGREFFVDDRVLIPRPETEILVEAAIQRAPRGRRIIDVGTGNGCIAVTIALERPDLHVFAVDVSPAALAVAQRNARNLGANVRFAASDVLSSTRRGFDLIVSNPPYIAARDIEQLQTEVRDHEPRVALTPGPRGMEVIERIVAQAGNAPVMLEIAFGQLDAVSEIAPVDDVLRDLAGIERVVVLSPHGRP
jgi:release factor glutamine methyltransferase